MITIIYTFILNDLLCLYIMFRYIMMQNANYGFFLLDTFPDSMMPIIGKRMTGSRAVTASGMHSVHQYSAIRMMVKPHLASWRAEVSQGKWTWEYITYLSSSGTHFYRRELLDVNEMHNTSKIQSQIYGNPFILGEEKVGFDSIYYIWWRYQGSILYTVW